MLPLLRMWRLRDLASPGSLARYLDAIVGSPRVSPPTRAYAARLRALYRFQEGEVSEARAEIAALGMVTDWQIVGPFDNEGKAGFGTEMPPESDRRGAHDPEAEYEGRERPVRWRAFPEIATVGYVDLDAVLRPNINVCAFAETYLHSERAQPLSLWVGAGGAVKVYFNGDEVISDEAYRNPGADRSVALVAARAGWNRVLVKECVTDGQWGFYFRVGGADGGVARGVRVDAEGASEISPARGQMPRLGQPPRAPLASFEAALAAAEDSAQANYQLARYLAYTGSDDPAQNRARQLAARAAELEPSVEHLLFAARTSASRADRMRFTALAEGVAPRDPRVRRERAMLIVEGPDPGRALRLFEDFPMNTVEGMRAADARASMLASRGLKLASLAIIDEALRRSGGAVYWLRRRIESLDALGRVDAAGVENARLLETQYSAFDARRRVVNLAHERGDESEVVAQLAVMRELEPGQGRTLLYAAGLLEGMGRHEDALELRRELVALAPEEAGYSVVLGQALLRRGMRDEALASLRRALSLRPQDASTRQLLERLERVDRPDEAYATPIETILARRDEHSLWPAQLLHDLQVETVYENGLGASFHQVAFQVHTTEGARGWSSYSVPFEPGRQWVDLRSARIYRVDGTVVEAPRTWVRSLGDPSYRIYYDTRAMVIDLPDLEPGDTVEIRYRVEDVSRRNVFNDYYGDVRILQRQFPTARLEHVLITPTSREFYTNTPALAGLAHEQRVEGEQRVDTYTVDDVPALRSEARMPGMTEVAPYLHISTYQSWEDVGRWWWGLARDQLHPDAELERTVARLVEGVADTRTKVERIYGWVIRNTRYVGLEFGIHGFKPYRVTQVVERGFGDCKDKASLLYVMLELAGVDARIALIRTRRNGLVEDSPASLAVFDHAIAYVPELDLFLDGTAEASGSRELPTMDQGVMTLLVGPDDVQLRRTPVLDAARERRERELRMSLRPDGSATISGSERVIGAGSSRYRNHYQAESTRVERLQEELAGFFPGLELESQSFADLDDYEANVAFEYQAIAPQAARRTGSELRVAPSIFGSLLTLFAPAPTRHLPMDLGSKYSYREVRVVELGEGLSVSEMPPGGAVSSPFGRLEVRYRLVEGAVRIETEMVLLRDRVEVSEYRAYRAWVQEADALVRERLVLGGAR